MRTNISNIFAAGDCAQKYSIITKKPLCASDSEIKENPPSRSAKLRVAEVTCK